MGNPVQCTVKDAWTRFVGNEKSLVQIAVPIQGQQAVRQDVAVSNRSEKVIMNDVIVRKEEG